MLQKIKNNKKNIILFGILVVFNFIVFGNIIKMHYSIDTFAMMGIGYKAYATDIFLKAGRPFSALITYIAGIFNVSIEFFVTFLELLAIIISTISVIVLKNKILSYKKANTISEEILVIVISYVTIFNFMYLDIFQFAECPIMALGYLVCIIAASILVERKKYYIIKCLSLLIIASFCYQGVMNSFVIFSVLFLIIKYKGQYKYTLKNIFIVALLYVIPMIINFLFTQQERKGEIQNIYINLKYIITSIPNIMTNSNYLFPKYVFLIIIMGLFMIFWLYFVKNGLKRCVKFFEPLFLYIVAFGTALAPHLFSLSSFPSGRLMFSVGAIIGILYIYMYTNTNILEEKYFRQALLTVLIIYASINIVNYYITFFDFQKSNQLNKEESIQINKWIEQYESSSGNKIEKVSFCYDKDYTDKHEGLISKSSYTIRTMGSDISIVESLKFYNNREFISNRMNQEEVDSYFKDENWNSLQKEQLKFEGDTVYYCIY